MTGTSRQDRREAIARIVYGLNPCMEQQADGDYRPLGPAFAVPWEDMADYDSGIHEAVLRAADAILALDEPEGLSELLAEVHACVWIPTAEQLDAESYQRFVAAREKLRQFRSALQPRGSAD